MWKCSGSAWPSTVSLLSPQNLIGFYQISYLRLWGCVCSPSGCCINCTFIPGIYCLPAFSHEAGVMHRSAIELCCQRMGVWHLASLPMFHRLRLDTSACTWCSSTAPASWRPEGKRAGSTALNMLPPNSVACKHSTSCWHTDPGSSHSSTSRSDTKPPCLWFTVAKLWALSNFA